VEDQNSCTVLNKSNRLIKTIQNIATIVSLVICNIIDSKKRFEKTALNEDFEELKLLFSTNHDIHRDFAINLIDTNLFPLTERNNYLSRDDFFDKMKKSNNVFLKPNEIRK
jgi:adenine C2-methylase RlmN of 23S rRNA A2503 and tRNA A37